MATKATSHAIADRRRIWRWIILVVQVAALVYLGLAAVLFMLQDSFIFPGASTQGQRDALLVSGEGTQVLSLSSPDHIRIAAIFGMALKSDALTSDAPASDGHPITDFAQRPTIIFFYGNGMCMAYCTDIFDHLRRLGMNVIIPDFEGYGMSGGKPSETGCYAAADAAYDYLVARGDVDMKKIVVVGWSLGGAAAIDLASRRPVAGLVTISAFTNLADMAHQLVKWIPISFILKYRFDNIDKLSRITCPILIVHGTGDELVPFSMAKELASAAKGNVQRYNVQGAGHNDVFDVGGEALMRRLETFISQLPPTH